MAVWLAGGFGALRYGPLWTECLVVTVSVSVVLMSVAVDATVSVSVFFAHVNNFSFSSSSSSYFSFSFSIPFFCHSPFLSFQITFRTSQRNYIFNNFLTVNATFGSAITIIWQSATAADAASQNAVYNNHITFLAARGVIGALTDITTK